MQLTASVVGRRKVLKVSYKMIWIKTNVTASWYSPADILEE